MGKLILTKQEAVEKYGTDAQKNHFTKYRKFTNSTLENALIKTLKQHYESVDTVKQGRSNVYKLGGKLGYIAEREDGRKNNGNTITLPYSNELNTLAINYIINNCQDQMQQFSISTWLNMIGLVDRQFTSAPFNDGIKESIMKNLIENFDGRFTENDVILLDNFISTERNRLTRNLISLFNRLHKNKLIRLRITMAAAPLKGNHVELSKEKEEEITILKRKLREKHNLTARDLVVYRYSNKVFGYKLEEEKELRKLGYKFTYTYYGVILNVEEKRLKDYLDKLKDDGKLEFEVGLTEEMTSKTLNYFREQYGERATDYASKRQDNTNKHDSNRIKLLKMTREYLPMYELLLIYFKLSKKKQCDVEFNGKGYFGESPY